MYVICMRAGDTDDKMAILVNFSSMTLPIIQNPDRVLTKLNAHSLSGFSVRSLLYLHIYSIIFLRVQQTLWI